jgi:phage pi2 protein 07
LKTFKVYLALSDDSIKQPLQDMIAKDFQLSQNEKDCDIYLTDIHTKKSTSAINMLVANVLKIPEFKGQADIEGFNHYVVYNENDFLVDRVKQALIRQWSVKQGLNDSNLTGVRALIPMENIQHSSGFDLPIVRSFEVSNSRERAKFAEEMEKFFVEIEPIIGGQSPILSQYAVEIQEELLMNAIWDANPKHENMPRTIPVDLEGSEKVKLEWGFNGKDLAISVKDNFGRLNPEIMAKYVKFIFKTGVPDFHQLAPQEVSAGLGMFMILQRANLLSVFIAQGRVTDVGVVICLSKKKRAKTQSPRALDIIHVNGKDKSKK